MQDIGSMLGTIMQENQCSSLCALFLLGETDGIHLLQSKPAEQYSRRLRDTSNKQGDRPRLGKDLS